MKIRIVIILVFFMMSSLLLPSPGSADVIPIDSKVIAVTVYPMGAHVTRSAISKVIGGDNYIHVDGLPGEVVPNSIRLEGKSLEKIDIRSVDVQQYFFRDDKHSKERTSISLRIETLKDEVSKLKLELADINNQRTLLQNLALQTVAPRNGENNSVAISAEELKALLTLTSDQHTELSKSTVSARIRRRELDKEIKSLQHRRSKFKPREGKRSFVAINLTSSSSGEVEFLIHYNVKNAGWAPVYDFNLLLDTKTRENELEGGLINVTRRADVFQQTTELWENVSLTLSTARPSGITHAPQISPHILKLQAQKSVKPKDKKRLYQYSSSQVNNRDKQVSFKPKKEKTARFLAEYIIPDLVSVKNTGRKKNVTIGSNKIPAEIIAHAVPNIDLTAYLVAEFEVPEEVSWPPGYITMSRDGVFLGNAKLPLLSPGQKHSLGFGADDFINIKHVQVKTEHAQVKEKKGKNGVILARNVEGRNFVTTISNRHDFAMRVSVKDQIPYSGHEDIKVEMTSETSKLISKNPNDNRGILEWDNTIESGQDLVIEFGYKVSWPRGSFIAPVQ